VGKRVLPVSPNVFYSYLKAILIGLEGKKVESKAQEILAAIRSIKEDSNKFSDFLRILTRHITNAKNSIDEVNRSYERLENRLGSLDSIPQEKDPLKIIATPSQIKTDIEKEDL
jgi:DNA anti-recombination protein RmuC